MAGVPAGTAVKVYVPDADVGLGDTLNGSAVLPGFTLTVSAIFPAFKVALARNPARLCAYTL